MKHITRSLNTQPECKGFLLLNFKNKILQYYYKLTLLFHPLVICQILGVNQILKG